jgi:large subunit ribosomal protein L23
MTEKAAGGEKKAKPEKNVSGKPAAKKVEKDKKKKDEKKGSRADVWNVLIHPHFAEKSMDMVEAENKLVFMVRPKANRKQVKWAVEKGFDVKVEKVNLQITRKGVKKAYIKLKPEYSAIDVATRLGMM